MTDISITIDQAEQYKNTPKNSPVNTKTYSEKKSILEKKSKIENLNSKERYYNYLEGQIKNNIEELEHPNNSDKAQEYFIENDKVKKSKNQNGLTITKRQLKLSYDQITKTIEELLSPSYIQENPESSREYLSNFKDITKKVNQYLKNEEETQPDFASAKIKTLEERIQNTSKKEEVKLTLKALHEKAKTAFNNTRKNHTKSLEEVSKKDLVDSYIAGALSYTKTIQEYLAEEKNEEKSEKTETANEKRAKNASILLKRLSGKKINKKVTGKRFLRISDLLSPLIKSPSSLLYDPRQTEDYLHYEPQEEGKLNFKTKVTITNQPPKGWKKETGEDEQVETPILEPRTNLKSDKEREDVLNKLHKKFSAEEIEKLESHLKNRFKEERT